MLPYGACKRRALEFFLAPLVHGDVKLMDQTYKAFPSSFPGQSGEHGDPELVQQRSRGSAGLHFRNAETEVRLMK